MKTLLIPILTLALTGLPALAQKPETTKGSPPPTGASGTAKATPVSPELHNPVQFRDATLNEVIDYLNHVLEAQGADVLNVVVGSDLDSVRVPSITLRNVTAGDVLNVVTKVTGLSLEPVPSDSGKVAAWIITRPKASASLGSLGIGFLKGGLGGDGAAGAGDAAEGSAEDHGGGTAPQAGIQLGIEPAIPPPGGIPVISTVPIVGRLFGAGSGPGATGGVGGAGVTWVDPAGGTPAPAQITRVFAIGRLYLDANEVERAEKEAMLVKMLRDMTEMQKLPCDTRLYPSLHVLVVKGGPEAVELVEQTISALKENAGVKKAEGSAYKFSPGIGTKN